MLTAFTARPLVELKSRDKSKIEALLTYGNRLLVGLSTGVLRVYRINEQAGNSDGTSPNEVDAEASSQPTVELLREVEKFSRRAVEQLAMIKEANILISLSDGYVSMHDLQDENYGLREQLLKTKGASTFAVTSNIIKDPSSGIPSIVSRLAVAVKRKLLLWSWHDTELSSSAVEVTLSAPARTLTWATGTNLVCGLNSGYVVVNVENREVLNILSSGGVGASGGQDEGRFGNFGAAGMGYVGMGNWVPKPLATTLTDGELLLAKDVNTLFVDQDFKPLDRRQIQWITAPDAIAFSYPYLLALQGPSRGVLEVRNPKTLSLLQSIVMPNAGRMHVPQPNVSLAHAGKGFLVASSRCLWRMTAESYDSQIGQLLEKGLLDEAISLMDMLEDPLLENKQERLREIKMQKAENLFQRRRYRAALDLFTEVSAPPERVIRLYPRVVAGDLASGDEPTVGKPAMESAVAQHEADGEAIAKSEEPVQEEKENIKEQEETESKAALEKTPSKASKGEQTVESQNSSRATTTTSLGVPSEDVLQGKDLKAALSELYSFLADTRRRLQILVEPDGSLRPAAQTGNIDKDAEKRTMLQNLVPNHRSLEEVDIEQSLRDILKLVDTTLFRAYMVERPSLAGSLFRIANFCDPDVVQEKLLETGRYEDLVDFLHGKRLHRQALELLRRFGQSTESEEAPTALRGPRRTVAYLQTLPPDFIDLILEFARWPLETDPGLGMEVFTADTENAENLPREKVLRFLQDIHSMLAVTYLEHIIHELNDLTPDFHQRLVNLYLEGLMHHDASEQEGVDGQLDVQEWREKLLSFLKSSNQYSTGRTFNLLPKDGAFFLSCWHDSPTLIPADPNFYEARAIVLSKMGNHKQALEIYVFKLEDHAKAEEYCNHIHLTQESETKQGASIQEKFSNEEASKSIYHTLLSLYLTPPAPYQPDWSAALNILSKHGSRLPASSILNLIPSSLPLQSLQSYFRGRLRAGTSTMNEGRILRGLCSSEHERLRAALIIGDELHENLATRNRSVVISEERVCRVCHKRLGRSVISVFPDNSVVHYGCANRVAQQA
ncbi:MAG: Diphthamide biosynthesis protein 1 [Watsoniomyces obsoletus]|nr:MAG: Diphthamide biosynthesis protein 1 [Watsoniomyces obsoletus]